MQNANQSDPLPAPAFLGEFTSYPNLRPLAIDPSLIAGLGLDPSHTFVSAAASGDSVPALVSYYQSHLADAGWQVAQKLPLNGQEQNGLQMVFSREQDHTQQTLILLSATPQVLAGNPRTAALAGKLPSGMNLLLLATLSAPARPAEPLEPPTSGLPQGVAAENMEFELDDGWTTMAQLTFPDHGNGHFPALVLIHGSGKNDMDETFPEAVAQVPGGSKFFRPIAYRLAQRGFAVLRFNKRGVTGLGPQLSSEPRFLSFKQPFTRYLNDARSIVEQARRLKRIDPNRLLLLGHSEGTVLASLIARSEMGLELAGLVLMGVGGYDVRTIVQYQFVDREVERIARTIDSNRDGWVSVEDFFDWFNTRSPAVKAANIQSLFDPDSGSPLGYRFKATLKPNSDGQVEIRTSLRDYLEQMTGVRNFPRLNGLPDDMVAYFEDYAHYGSVTSILPGFMRPVLMLNGASDMQTLVEGARLADTALEEAGNPDHKLITYPGLGHSFYPVNGMDQPLGPPRPDVIEDLGDWLTTRFLYEARP